MSQTNWNNVKKYFGSKFAAEGARHTSYGILEQMVLDAPRNSSGIPNTEKTVTLFRPILKDMSDKQLAFLIVHSGFIPDNYDTDGSDETLYSKLVEVLVAEWGERIGLATELPTAKASTEDVTFILNDSEVVVCDVKSYRLGRSQAAPNVKDLIKAEDFNKWAKGHTTRSTTGGLVTFPSRFDFKKESDVYLYASNSTAGRRILILFYEHLAYMLVRKNHLAADSFFSIIHNYEQLFTAASKNRDAYWQTVIPEIERIAADNTFDAFHDTCQTILDDLVSATITRIETRIKETKLLLRKELKSLSEDELRERLLPSELEHRSGEDMKRLVNVRKFRT